MKSILFVCLGNICRSPAAKGVLEHMLEKERPGLKLYVESCGLGDWHKGMLPDERMRAAAKKRGIILKSQAKAFKQEYFEQFDWILAADQKILFELYRWGKEPERKAKTHLITKFSSAFKDKEIPDPFYMDLGYFDLVLDMLEDSCRGLIAYFSSHSKQQ